MREARRHRRTGLTERRAAVEVLRRHAVASARASVSNVASAAARAEYHLAESVAEARAAHEVYDEVEARGQIEDSRRELVHLRRELREIETAVGGQQEAPDDAVERAVGVVHERYDSGQKVGQLADQEAGHTGHCHERSARHERRRAAA